MNWDYSSHNFYIEQNNIEFIVEAITADKGDDRETYDWSTEITQEVIDDYLNNMDDYYRYSVIRLSHAFKSKLNAYKSIYSNLPHVQHKPFIIAIAPFDQPLHHLLYDGPMLTLLYDMYIEDEVAKKNPSVFLNGIPYSSLQYVEKDNGNKIMLGLFNDDRASEISAIIFNHTATVGKASYLSEDIHSPQHMWEVNGSLVKAINEQELLEDGLFIFHNPFAKNKLPIDIFSKNRICQVFMDKDTFVITKYYGDKHLFTRGIFNIN